MPLTRDPINRRSFLKALGGAAAGLSIGSCAGRPIPASGIPAVNPPGPITSAVAVTRAGSYDRKLVRRQVEAALDALGGVGDLIRPGARVALKVNLTGGSCCPAPSRLPRTETYWTHPEVVRALGELLRDAGAGKLSIVEGLFTEDSFQEAGYSEIADSLAADLIDINKPTPYAEFARAAVGAGWLVYEEILLHPLLNEVDAFVSIPKMKCHLDCGITASMKNLIGLGPMPQYWIKPEDGRRSCFHNGADGTADSKSRLPRVVVDINRARPIHLALVDAIATIDGGEGPWVENVHPQTPGLLLAGKNATATDTVAAAVMGFDPSADYPQTPFLHADNHLNLARAAGLGTNRLEEIDVRGIAGLEEVRMSFAPARG